MARGGSARDEEAPQGRSSSSRGQKDDQGSDSGTHADYQPAIAWRTRVRHTLTAIGAARAFTSIGAG